MNRSIGIVIFLIIAAIFAIVLAVDVGTENYEQLGIYASVAVIIYFFVHGWKNVWWFASSLVFSGVVFFQGFVFEGDHLFVLMLVLASVMALITRSLAPPVRELQLAGSRSTGLIVGLLLAYGGLHFLVNYVFPYSSNDYSLKTSSKAYFECYASMVCFFWLLVGPYSFRMKSTWPRTLLWIISLSLFGNVAIRGLMYYQGFQAAEGGSNDLEQYYLNVPIINMQAGVFTLRNLCPMATAIVLMIATAPGWWRGQKLWMKILVLDTVGLIFVGALFSGGRATVLFCLALAFLVALVRRRVAIISLMSMTAVLVIALANVFSNEINTNAPVYVARSLQLVMLDKGKTAEMISGSQDSRDAAFDEALVQWRSDNRVLFFGRSVFHITWDDALYMGQRFGIDGFVENAMRSGRTHNLLTDLLLQYGLVGATLYLTAYVAIIRFFWKLYRVIGRENPVPKAIVGAMAIYLPLIFVYQLLGGQFMPSVAALVLGITRAGLAMIPQPTTSTAVVVEPARGPTRRRFPSPAVGR
ncbi:hypothetical protein [Luteolibacter marinus]|uniref:hypothetical protein n=1 Tax=Luteolibacter marinus TaxID=2776705 RepID=UPI001867AF55|nr:hypothetical protein [Luteolibacter marinus]